MSRRIALLLVGGLVLALGSGVHWFWPSFGVRFWQRQVSPGPLSAAHAWLEGDCEACHTPMKSADAAKCVGCHANNAALLQRQPTAFHATIGACGTCHAEHSGPGVRPVTMDHVALSVIGLKGVRSQPDNVSSRRLLAWVRQHETAAERGPTHPEVTPTEAGLDCATCHSTKDRHQGYFGGDCASCHRTAAWTIPRFRHPSPRSVLCAECHQAAPSHYMMHFRMVSQVVARAPDARVEQCFRCHQTTSWNDIRGVGWYKHH